jgi:sugar lactone lactonase YvrE
MSSRKLVVVAALLLVPLAGPRGAHFQGHLSADPSGPESPERWEAAPSDADGVSGSAIGFPGGGRILSSNGVVVSDGGTNPISYLPGLVRGPAHLVWDPLVPDAILAIPQEPVVRSYRLIDGTWRPLGRWPVETAFATLSQDGRSIAYSPFRPDGTMKPGTIEVLDRKTHETRVMRWGHDLYPIGWAPDGRLIVSGLQQGGVLAWDLDSELAPQPLLGAEDVAAAISDDRTDAAPLFDRINWSADGRYFSIPLWSNTHPWAIAVVSSTGEVVDVIETSGGYVNVPIWSPTGHELAFMTNPRNQDGTVPRAKLFVYDLETQRRTLLASGLSEAHWVSWSPDGDWLLVDDWMRERWIFEPREGGQSIETRAMGLEPRWCCSSPPSGGIASSPAVDVQPLEC